MPITKESYQRRAEKLRNRVAEFSVDGLLILNQENVCYLSGFSGSSGALIITERAGLFLTDGRYTTQAKEEVAGLEVEIYKDKIKGIRNSALGLGLHCLGFEPEALSYKEFSDLAEALPGVELRPVKKELEWLRVVKDNAEIALIKEAIAVASAAFQHVLEGIAPGKREEDVALELEYEMRRGGGSRLSFDLIVASGWRAALPHGKASVKRLEPGDLVIIDYGTSYLGYYSDETHTVALAPVSEKQKEVYQVVREAHHQALAAVRPGASFEEIDRAARGTIEAAGYGPFFSHGTGHGLGLAIHEPPALGPERPGEAQAGMVITIEPGIYIPGWGGVRLEDVVLVTEGGCEVLTRLPKELWIL